MIGGGLGPLLIGIVSDLLEPRYGQEALRWSLALAMATYVVGIAAFVVVSDADQPLPPFLEGAVHALRSCPDAATARRLHAAVRASALYDAPLGMYRVNAPLDAESFEERARLPLPLPIPPMLHGQFFAGRPLGVA